MLYTYCPTCGKPLDMRLIGDEGLVPYCDTCLKPWFSIAPLCVLAMVINEYDEVCLLTQNYVSKTHKVFVAGYYKPGESAEAAIKREIFEEIGQTVIDLNYLGSHYREKIDAIFLHYVARVKKAPLVLSSEVDDAKWYKLPIDENLLNKEGAAYMIYQAYKNK